MSDNFDHSLAVVAHDLHPERGLAVHLINVLYKPSKNLFGDDSEQKIERPGTALLKWRRGRLHTVFSEGSKAALIRNTRGGHLYYLLLASHNKIGVKIANPILSAGEVV